MSGVFFLYPQQVIDSPGQQFVLNNAAITADGYQVISGFGSNELVLVINIKNAPTGTLPTLTFTMQEVDPIDQTTVIGSSVSSAALNGTGITILTKSDGTVGTVKVSWHIGGTGVPTFTGVNVTMLQRVAGSSVEITDGTNTLGTPTHPIKIDPIGSTVQPVSGTVTANAGTGSFTVAQATAANLNATVTGSVTANIGTTNGLALDATLTGGTATTRITDGTNTATVKASNTAAVTTDKALVVAVSPNNTVTTISSTQSANIDAGNSSTTPLGSGGSFTGAGIDVSGYGTIIVFVFADQAGTLNVQFSTNNVNWDDTIIYNIGANDAEHVQIGPQARYFRVTYVNGSVPQSVFRLQTIEKPIISFGPTIPIAETVDGPDDAILTKSVITGKTIGISGVYTDVLVNPAGNLSIYLGDSPNVSTLGRLRVGSPLTLFSNKQLYNSQPLVWDDQQTSGAGTSSTFLTNKSATQMTVTQNVPGTRTRQTFRRMHYQPGKSQLCLFSGVLVNEGGIGNAAVNRRIGIFDGYNGFFFELTGTTMNVAIRTSTSGSPVTTYTPQSSWNLDTFDGYGPSGFKLDVSKAQLFIVDYSWDGLGRIRYGFEIAGQVFYCHQTIIENTQSLVSVSIPNLPIRYEIQSLGTGAATTSSMQHICATVISEGGQEDIGFTFAADTGSTGLTTGNNTSIYALIALQVQSNMLGAIIEPTFFTATSVTANAQFKIMLILNPTIAGTALAYTPVTNSAAQFATGDNTNTITGGTVLYSGYFFTNKNGSVTDQLTIDIGIGASIAGVSDTLVLAIQPTPALAIAALASINWKEQV